MPNQKLLHTRESVFGRQHVALKAGTALVATGYALAFSLALLACGGCSKSQGSEAKAATGTEQQSELLNVSYDPTREFYQEYNPWFFKQWKEKTYSLPLNHRNAISDYT